MTPSITVLSAKCHYAECRYAECRYAECRYAESLYAECRGAFSSAKRSSLLCQRVNTASKRFYKIAPCSFPCHKKFDLFFE